MKGMKLLTRMARAFVAGYTVDEALKQVQKLKDKGIMVTLDILGEAVEDKPMCDKAVQDYLDLLKKLAEVKSEAHISLKLTQMGLAIDDEYCIQNMVKIIGLAKISGRFVRIDMEGSAVTERTLKIFYRLRQQFDNAGIVVQAYLYRTEKDVRNINALKAKVRLCNGAYKEPKEVAIKKMKAIRVNFIKLAEMLFREGVYPAIATHDSKLIKWTKAYTAENKIKNSDWEFQFLYGIRNKTQRKLAEEGYRVRTYVPFGTHWIPYFYRRLRERKENVFFLTKNFFKR
ncbi:MAG: proline dehydrogenase family protein [Candidatus Aminicenantes bacterium]|nr:proline dehydrogenase family protein [Candidatus Aminicenantes bacterium]